MVASVFLVAFLCFYAVSADFFTDRPTNLRSILYPTYGQRPNVAAEYYGNYEIPSLKMMSTISGFNNLLNRNLRSTDEQQQGILPRPLTIAHERQAEGFQLYPYYTGLGKGR